MSAMAMFQQLSRGAVQSDGHKCYIVGPSREVK